ncbi:MAG: DedA family protein [Pseudomonadota bacterium]|jgi:membrane-associated protein|nr:DedA family protein [Pseudomonadota bacterium]
MITTLLYSLLALDQSLSALAAQHAWLMFAALFMVIFAETGLVIFPLLPGDSLLFVAGTVAAASGVNVHLLALTLLLAAVLGDSVNYSIGHFIGPKVLSHPRETRLGRWLKPEYMDRTHRFYEKYGGFTIIIGRFVPVVRTFAPFLAGVGQMRYRKFLAYNVIGGTAWVGLLLYTGYLFGNIPWVKNNLAWIVLGIIVVSLLPIAFQWLKERRERKQRLENLNL